MDEVDVTKGIFCVGLDFTFGGWHGDRRSDRRVH